jgi:ubiquinone/menaquinone biosynthesis C-methylase UbiE
MSILKQIVKSSCDAILNPLGYEIRRKIINTDGFPEYLAKAQKAGMDVNDWEEQVLGWAAALPILEQTVFPLIKADSVVCNVGIGTARWAKYLAPRLSSGELHLVDHSPWIINFARNYLRSQRNVHFHLTDGLGLPFSDHAKFDLIFSFGTFIALKLGVYYLYSRDFFRVLKPGGYSLIHYLDITTPGGWGWLENASNKHYANCYTYQTREVVERVFTSAGFEILPPPPNAGLTLLVAKKPNSSE